MSIGDSSYDDLIQAGRFGQILGTSARELVALPIDMAEL
jgi:hypothetical protein